MARVTLDLPHDLKAKAEARAAESGHNTVEEYVRSLIEADAAAPDDAGGPPHLSFQSDKELEAFLLHRIDETSSIEATPEFWQDFRREFESRRRAADSNTPPPARPESA